VPLAAETVSALTVASAFLVASLSIMVVVYALQWNYFNNKGTNRSREEEIQLKDEARERTRLIFRAELAYILLAFGAVFVNVQALREAISVDAALTFSFFSLLVFLGLVTEEFSSSIRHLENRFYSRR